MIFHMAHKSDWQRALDQGRLYTGSTDDQRDGFIHFSTAKQIPISAAKHRAGQTDLLLIAVDPSVLGDALRWETSRDQQDFPHLYGALDPKSVAWAEPLPWDANQAVHVFPHIFAG